MYSFAGQFLASPYACSIIWEKSLNYSKPPFSTSVQSEVMIKWALSEIMYLKHLEERMTSGDPQHLVILKPLTTLWP